MIRDTSRAAFDGLQAVLSDRQAAVLAAIKRLGECSDQDIARALGWGINRITGRRGELVTLGHVEEAGRKVNEFGRPVMTWRVKVAAPQVPAKEIGPIASAISGLSQKSGPERITPAQGRLPL